MSQNENINLNQENKLDPKLEAKFDYLYQEVHKNHKDTKMLDELDNVLQNKFSHFLNLVNSKIEKKCKNELEKLHVYTEYNKDMAKLGKAGIDSSASGNLINPNNIDSNDFLNLTPSKGYEKEFHEANDSLKECLNEMKFLESDITINNQAISDLTLNSTRTCLDECKQDIQRKRNSEYETRKCIEACLKYRRFNMEAYYKIMFDNIESKEKALEKI